MCLTVLYSNTRILTLFVICSFLHYPTLVVVLWLVACGCGIKFPSYPATKITKIFLHNLYTEDLFWTKIFSSGEINILLWLKCTHHKLLTYVYKYTSFDNIHTLSCKIETFIQILTLYQLIINPHKGLCCKFSFFIKLPSTIYSEKNFGYLILGKMLKDDHSSQYLIRSTWLPKYRGTCCSAIIINIWWEILTDRCGGVCSRIIH